MPYLQGLGVSHLYASPILKARPKSGHGYDVIDPTVLNPELGSDDDFARLVSELHKRGMGLILDIVPNHMAADTQNPCWNDVLENGRASEYVNFFDIDWEPSDAPRLRNRVLVPALGAPLRDCLAGGELQLVMDESGVGVNYFESRYPLDPATYRLALEPALNRLSGPAADALRGVIKSSRTIPQRDDARPSAIRRRREGCESTKLALASAVRRHPELRAAVSACGDGPTLRRTLDAQAYALEYWRAGAKRINYRRFFDITGLVGVRVEDPEVFEATHQRVCDLVRSGAVSGVRVDHVDGLRDPAGYLSRLRNHLANEGDPIVLVEKILSSDEHLRRSWPVAGTTGYEFLARVDRLFVSPDGLRALKNAWAANTGSTQDFSGVVYREKKRMIRTLFEREMRSLAHQLSQVVSEARIGRVSSRALSNAIVEVTAQLPVYRTYVRGARMSRRDRQLVEEVVASADKGRRGQSREAFFALRRVLTLDFPPGIDRSTKKQWIDFVERWQQFTGPAMAKGQEDTAFYVYSALISLNEVGGDPGDVLDAVAEFHSHNVENSRRWPQTMNASSTHDTKRSEDVRARITVLSELHQDWLAALRRWRTMNAPHRHRIAGVRAPDANQESILYQTLLGTWPLDGRVTDEYRSRIEAYMIKAGREAKVHTSWLAPDEAHEAVLSAFTASCLGGGRANPFLRDLAAFHKRIAYYGAINSLAQTVLKATAPGVPDFYQGTEFWDYSLVDPDNRRPVDFEQLRKRMHGLTGQASSGRARRLLNQWPDGGIKMYVVRNALKFRQTNAELFRQGRYLPLHATGPLANNVVAFARIHRDQWCVTVAPRLLANVPGEEESVLGDFWGGTSLRLPAEAPLSFTNVLTGRRLDRLGTTSPLSECLRDLPVAILQGES